MHLKAFHEKGNAMFNGLLVGNASNTELLAKHLRFKKHVFLEVELDEAAFQARIQLPEVVVFMLDELENEALHVIMDIRNHSSVPILVNVPAPCLSPTWKTKLINAGVSLYISELWPKLIEGIMYNQVQMHAGQRTNILSHGSLTCYVGTRIVVGEGGKTTENPLPRREFNILEYLMRRPEVMVPKRRMFDHLYGADCDVLEKVLESHISKLRTKLRSLTSDVELATLRFQGYMITQNPAYLHHRA